MDFDWHRIFLGNEISHLFLLEVCFRVVFIYLFTVVSIRFMGKRGNRSLSVFENVLIIALGSATGDAMFYPKVPLLYACIVIVLIVFFTRLLQNLQLWSKPFNKFLDGTPLILVDNGKIQTEGLKKCRVRTEELYGMLRHNNVEDLAEVKFAIFERSGNLSVIKHKDPKEENPIKNIVAKEVL